MADILTPTYSAEEFRARALLSLGNGAVANEDYGDHRFNPGHPRLKFKAELRNAAVLIPVVDRGPDATVLLTKRNELLRNHSGQVAFPGGRIDPEDVSPEAAALREADEEIGLKRSFIEVIGRMPDYVSGSGYRIAPVLGIVQRGFHLTLNPDEVDTAFEVPLSFLMDAANHHESHVDVEQRLWRYYEMPYGGQRIWGVTAGILRTLYERLYA